MTRLLNIARREYVAYVRTFGFWLSLLLLPVGLSSIGLAPLLMSRATPTPHVAVVNFTGFDVKSAIAQALAAPGLGGKPLGQLVDPPDAPFADAADAAKRLKPYLQGPDPRGEALDAVAIIRPSGGTATIDFWTRSVSDQSLQIAVGAGVRSAMRRAGLERQGIDPKVLTAIDSLTPVVVDFSPKAETGHVGLRERLTGLAGFAMGLLLWMVVLTGAGMLLNSVMEEKSSRILEVLLTSASVTEIMIGKILGVAAVTATVLALWLTIAGVILTARSPAVAADVVSILLSHGRWVYLSLYFIGGYLMFATLYVTIGAFCETSREAQTLLGPMMILMSLPLLFMSSGLNHPDAPILRALAWVPLFTPFMMAARAATDPPIWEIVSTLALIFGVTALELWVAIPAFKSGALATGRFDLRNLLRTVGRRASA